VRRKFVEPTAGRKNTAAAHQMVALIGKLYQIERTVRGEAPEQRHAIRQEQSRPVLDKIKSWLDDKAPRALPKGLLGKAIHYTLELWPQLNTFLEDGHIELDNNTVHLDRDRQGLRPGAPRLPRLPVRETAHRKDPSGTARPAAAKSQNRRLGLIGSMG